MQKQIIESIPRSIKSNQKQTTLFKLSGISIIPNIPQANQILPKQLQLSKPVSHLFLHDFQDIKSESGVMQQLYNSNHNYLVKQVSQRIFCLNAKSENRDSINQKNKIKIKTLRNLKDFFLQNSSQILFISRTVTLVLSSSQRLLFKKLLSYQNKNYLSFTNQQLQKYSQSLQKLSQILSNNHKFPFLCPQLNQTISQKFSLKNKPKKKSGYLTFDDNFESSNILMVKQHFQTQFQSPTYCICTRFDYQTSSYGQWFYFSVKRSSQSQLVQEQKQTTEYSFGNQLKKKKYKFVICNMTKKYSMLGRQMKISVCRKGKWVKEGQNICYYQNIFKRGNKKVDNQNLTSQQIQNFIKFHEMYYALRFQLDLAQNQQIFVSYNQPYTVSRLSKQIDNFSKIYSKYEKPEHKFTASSQNSQIQLDQKNEGNSFQEKLKNSQAYYKRQTICQTPLKNQVQCLSFSMKKQATQSKFRADQVKNDSQNQNKKIIFIFARAHPIQTAGSFVVQGILKNLFLFLEFKNDAKRKLQLQQYFKAQNTGLLYQNLLKNYVVKIIPMINPDGVILGNSRCNIYGFDLNRQWKKSNKVVSSQIYNIKRYLLKFKGEIQMVIDLHGHSKKKNVFAYGMHDFRNPFSTRQFPYILSKLSQKDFLFQECRFTRLSDLKQQNQTNSITNCKQNVKQGTARIWLFRKLQIPNIFTIENSYCGSIHRKYHYDYVTYGDIGLHILFGMGLYFLNSGNNQSKKQSKSMKNKEFKDINSEQLGSTTQSINDLKALKNSFIFDLKSKQQNATIGMEQINSSESEQQNRIQESIDQKKSTFKTELLSPNKIRSHKVIKKSFQSKDKNKEKPIKKYRYLANEGDLQLQKVYDFQSKESKAKLYVNQSQERTQNCRYQQVKARQNNRFIPTQTRQRAKEISLQKKQYTNQKSTSQLQRNATLSIVQIGWDKSKVTENKYCFTDRTYDQELLNFPHINSNPQMIYAHQSNVNLSNKFNQKIKSKIGICNQSLPKSPQKGYIQQTQQKPSQSSMIKQVLQKLQKLQQRKNVSQFMKKIQSNKKIQSQIVTTRKIEKYKQIISRINKGKNIIAQ